MSKRGAGSTIKLNALRQQSQISSASLAAEPMPAFQQQVKLSAAAFADAEEYYAVYCRLCALGWPCTLKQALDGFTFLECTASTTEQAQEAVMLLPVSQRCKSLTPACLQGTLKLHGTGEKPVLLAIVAIDRSVVFSKLHNGLFPPAF